MPEVDHGNALICVRVRVRVREKVRVRVRVRVDHGNALICVKVDPSNTPNRDMSSTSIPILHPHHYPRSTP